MSDENRITYFAKADYRNKLTPFGIKAEDRTRHVYVIGKTGMGKSNLLENMAVQDIQNGEGIGFIDPHGSTAELLLDYVPEHRVKDVIYFAPFDTDYPVSFNIMEDVGRDRRHLVASGLMSAFKKIWVDAWSARMEYILNNTILALLEFPGATLLGVNRMLTDKEFRKKVVENITDPSIKSFWVDEFAKYSDKYAQEATPAIQNKVGQFISNPLIRNIIGQSKSTFDIREVMDSKKILIMNLSKGRIGESNTNLLGSMLITKIYLSAMSRADVPKEELKKLANFNFFVDEFQSFANESFADILSEARKYKLNLTIAHQYIEQMPEEVRAAVFGNVGTMITFRVGAYDADFLEKEFLPAFSAEDLVGLDKYQLYLKLMIDGVGSKPFSAIGLPPVARAEHSFKEEILENSRKMFARPRADVEQEILEWHQTSYAATKPPPLAPPVQPLTPAQGAPYGGNVPPPPRAFQQTVFSPSPIAQRPEVKKYQPNGVPPQRTFERRPSAPVGQLSHVQSNEPPQPQYERRHFDRRKENTPYGHNPGNTEYRRAGGNERTAVNQPPPPIQQVPMQNLPIGEELVSVSSPGPISLSALKKNNVQKSPETMQNKNSLKEALHSLVGENQGKTEAKAKVAEKPVEAPVSKPILPPVLSPVAKAQEIKNQENVITEACAPKEIPEEVLRGMLSVDEDYGKE